MGNVPSQSSSSSPPPPPSRPFHSSSFSSSSLLRRFDIRGRNHGDADSGERGGGGRGGDGYGRAYAPLGYNTDLLPSDDDDGEGGGGGSGGGSSSKKRGLLRLARVSAKRKSEQSESTDVGAGDDSCSSGSSRRRRRRRRAKSNKKATSYGTSTRGGTCSSNAQLQPPPLFNLAFSQSYAAVAIRAKELGARRRADDDPTTSNGGGGGEFTYASAGCGNTALHVVCGWGGAGAERADAEKAEGDGGDADEAGAAVETEEEVERQEARHAGNDNDNDNSNNDDDATDKQTISSPVLDAILSICLAHPPAVLVPNRTGWYTPLHLMCWWGLPESPTDAVLAVEFLIGIADVALRCVGAATSVSTASSSSFVEDCAIAPAGRKESSTRSRWTRRGMRTTTIARRRRKAKDGRLDYVTNGVIGAADDDTGGAQQQPWPSNFGRNDGGRHLATIREGDEDGDGGCGRNDAGAQTHSTTTQALTRTAQLQAHHHQQQNRRQPRQSSILHRPDLHSRLPLHLALLSPVASHSPDVLISLLRQDPTPRYTVTRAKDVRGRTPLSIFCDKYEQEIDMVLGEVRDDELKREREEEEEEEEKEEERDGGEVGGVEVEAVGAAPNGGGGAVSIWSGCPAPAPDHHDRDAAPSSGIGAACLPPTPARAVTEAGIVRVRAKAAPPVVVGSCRYLNSVWRKGSVLLLAGHYGTRARLVLGEQEEEHNGGGASAGASGGASGGRCHVLHAATALFASGLCPSLDLWTLALHVHVLQIARADGDGFAPVHLAVLALSSSGSSSWSEEEKDDEEEVTSGGGRVRGGGDGTVLMLDEDGTVDYSADPTCAGQRRQAAAAAAAAAAAEFQRTIMRVIHLVQTLLEIHPASAFSPDGSGRLPLTVVLDSLAERRGRRRQGRRRMRRRANEDGSGGGDGGEDDCSDSNDHDDDTVAAALTVEEEYLIDLLVAANPGALENVRGMRDEFFPYVMAKFGRDRCDDSDKSLRVWISRRRSGAGVCSGRCTVAGDLSRAAEARPRHVPDGGLDMMYQLLREKAMFVGGGD